MRHRTTTKRTLSKALVLQSALRAEFTKLGKHLSAVTTGQSATNETVRKLHDSVTLLEHRLTLNLGGKIETAVRQSTAELKGNFSDVQTSVDRYLKRTEDRRHDHTVLRSQHEHLVRLLQRKGVVTEEETSLGG